MANPIDNASARFMLKEVDDRVSRGAKRIQVDAALRLERVRAKVVSCRSLSKDEGVFLQQLYERCTELTRIKW